MKSKDKQKRNKRLKVTVKNIIGLVAFIISILYIIIFYNFYFVNNDVYAKETDAEVTNITISNAKEVNLDEIIETNSNQGKKEEFYTEEAELEYLTTYRNNSSLPKGTIQVVQEGREGKQEVTKKRTYENDEIVSEEIVNTKITKGAINKIVEIGTGSYRANYEVKVGDKVFVTSDRLSVMLEPDENSQKMYTLAQNDELKVLEIVGEWYYVSFGTKKGYVKKEATTYIDVNAKQEGNSGSSSSTGGDEKSKSELISTLSFNMALNKPSGLSLEQFKKILTDDKDTNNVFSDNAEYFYYIEKQYNINGVFVAAVGIHESGWGTSKISLEKYNLFGYGAYDSSPYNSAYDFSDYSESIDLIARVFVKYYINPAGTSIYGGEVASGKYYNGSTLSGVNTRYATDKNWANAVYKHMEYLYNKL